MSRLEARAALRTGGPAAHRRGAPRPRLGRAEWTRKLAHLSSESRAARPGAVRPLLEVKVRVKVQGAAERGTRARGGRDSLTASVSLALRQRALIFCCGLLAIYGIRRSSAAQRPKGQALGSRLSPEWDRTLL